MHEAPPLPPLAWVIHHQQTNRLHDDHPRTSQKRWVPNESVDSVASNERPFEHSAIRGKAPAQRYDHPVAASKQRRPCAGKVDSKKRGKDTGAYKMSPDARETVKSQERND